MTHIVGVDIKNASVYSCKMSKKEKLLQKARNNPDDLLFLDFTALLKQVGWVFKRQNGSHQIWHSQKGHRLPIQSNKGKAKGYQVKQFIIQLDKEEGV